MTNLPRTLPAGTVVFVPDGEPRLPKCGDWFKYVDDSNGYCLAEDNHPKSNPNRRIYTRHVITAPLHILDEGMVEAVRIVDECSACCNQCRGKLRAAFAHVLIPPQETVKEEGDPATYDARMFMMLSSNLHPDYRKAMERLCDVLDAQQKSIAALRAEVKEGRNGR